MLKVSPRVAAPWPSALPSRLRIPGPVIRRVAVLLAAVLLLVPADRTRGRVFFTWGRAAHGAATAGQPGWNLAYRSDVRLNGGAGEMEVVGAQMDIAEAARAVESAYRALGAKVFLLRAQGFAFGVAVWDDRVVRLLLADVGRREECIVFRLDQTRDDFRRSAERPTEHLLTALPVPVGARPRLFAADEGAAMQVEVSETAGAGALDRLDAQLTSQGWISVLPPDPRRGPPAATMYLRGSELCVLQVAPGEGGGAVITRLYKRLRTDESPR